MRQNATHSEKSPRYTGAPSSPSDLLTIDQRSRSKCGRVTQDHPASNFTITRKMQQNATKCNTFRKNLSESGTGSYSGEASARTWTIGAMRTLLPWTTRCFPRAWISTGACGDLSITLAPVIPNAAKRSEESRILVSPDSSHIRYPLLSTFSAPCGLRVLCS